MNKEIDNNIDNDNFDDDLKLEKCYYAVDGNRIFVTNHSSVVESINPGIYVVKTMPMTGEFYLEAESNNKFSMPDKIYGSQTRKNADRILKTYLDRAVNTGILLSGEKGSGKTLLSKYLANECIKLGMPVLIINTPVHGNAFNKFIVNIRQECVIIFDEFEKVYDFEHQEGLLSLLDGLYTKKNLNIFTCNELTYINTYMLNRPSRIYYNIEFFGLAEDFVRSYCEDNLLNKEFLENVIKISSTSKKFNFDMLQALVQELNRFNCTIEEALSYLNITVDSDEDDEEFQLSIVDVNTGSVLWVHPERAWFSPMTDNRNVAIPYNIIEMLKRIDNCSKDGNTTSFSKVFLNDSGIEYVADNDDEFDDDGNQRVRVILSPGSIIDVNIRNGVYVYSLELLDLGIKKIHIVAKEQGQLKGVSH